MHDGWTLTLLLFIGDGILHGATVPGLVPHLYDRLRLESEESDGACRGLGYVYFLRPCPPVCLCRSHVVNVHTDFCCHLHAGFRFEGLYLPWALIAFTVLVGSNPMTDILGVIAGHLYYFLLEVLPATKGWNVLQTPAVL